MWPKSKIFVQCFHSITLLVVDCYLGVCATKWKCYIQVKYHFERLSLSKIFPQIGISFCPLFYIKMKPEDDLMKRVNVTVLTFTFGRADAEMSPCSCLNEEKYLQRWQIHLTLIYWTYVSDLGVKEGRWHCLQDLTKQTDFARLIFGLPLLVSQSQKASCQCCKTKENTGSIEAEAVDYYYFSYNIDAETG